MEVPNPTTPVTPTSNSGAHGWVVLILGTLITQSAMGPTLTHKMQTILATARVHGVKGSVFHFLACDSGSTVICLLYFFSLCFYGNLFDLCFKIITQYLGEGKAEDIQHLGLSMV